MTERLTLSLFNHVTKQKQGDNILHFLLLLYNIQLCTESIVTIKENLYFLLLKKKSLGLGIYLTELKNNIHMKNLHIAVYSSFIRNCQNLEASKMSFSL